jgi:hypothetical protein
MKESGMVTLTKISRLIWFLSIIVFSNYADIAFCYPIVSQECKSDPIACSIDGKLTIVSIYGLIGSEDSKFFREIDRVIPADQPFPKVYLNSQGGRTQDAMIIGRILRKRHGSVESGSPFLKYDFTQCSSACVIVAAGASYRLLNHIGLHQGHYDLYEGPTKWLPTPASEADTNKMFAYFDEMGINPQIKDIIKNTPFNDMYDTYYDSKVSYLDQTITKLGFHMENRSARGNIIFPTRKMIEEFETHTFWEAVNYGSNQAILDFVTNVLRTSSTAVPNYELASKIFQIGIDRNDPVSMFYLANYLQLGLGVEKDEKKAIELSLKSARLGYHHSQNNIGWSYYKGIGVNRNIPEAVFWVTRSADQGNAFAYGSLCEMYDGGDVFIPNNVEAYKWCQLAVNSEPDGDEKTNDAEILVKFRKLMSQKEINEGEALTKSWKPIKSVSD